MTHRIPFLPGIQFLLSGLLLMACEQPVMDHPALPGEKYTALTDNGAWCWFSDPRAVYYKGKHTRVYSGWVDDHGNIIAGYYDIDLRSIKHVQLDPEFEFDDHDNPALLISEEGKICVFYSKHGHHTPIYFRQSKKPEDISEWEPRRELYLNDTITYRGFLNSYTYANICRLRTEDDILYLFWRGMDFKPNYSTSADGGHTWSPGRILILPERIYKNRRPYLKICSDNENEIHFAFTNGHPRDEPTNSIYYFKYRNGSFYMADGEKISDMNSLPVDPDDADLVYNARDTGEKSWIWDIAVDDQNRPVIVYVRFPDDSAHHYYYARWDGQKWNNHLLVNSGGWFPQTPEGSVEREPNYSGGMVLDHEDPDVVFLSVQRKGIFEIEKWITPDEGKTWKNYPVTENSKNHNVRPFAIRNSQETLAPQVVWMNIEKYVHYTSFRASIRMDIPEKN
jgi:hypothetical protein